MDVRLEQLEQEMKTYGEFMETMTSILINQFLELVKSYVESIVHVFRKTDLSIVPSLLEGHLLGDFKSSSPSIFKFQVDICDFEGKNDTSSPSFACVYPLETSFSMETPVDASIIQDQF